MFSVRVAVLLPGPDGSLEAAFAEEGTLDADDKDLGVAEWAWLHQRPAGIGTDTLPSARALFIPLKGSRGRVGVLALYPSAATRLGDPDERQLLDTFAGLVGSALERAQLAEEARRARLQAETEQLRNSLLVVRLARPAHAARRRDWRHERAARRARPAVTPRCGASSWRPSTRRPCASTASCATCST